MDSARFEHIPVEIGVTNEQPTDTLQRPSICCLSPWVWLIIVKKSGIEKIVLGMSGGIDSAVCAAIACDAAGPENVLGLAMPSRHSSDHSIEPQKGNCKPARNGIANIVINDIHSRVDKIVGHELNSDILWRKRICKPGSGALCGCSQCGSDGHRHGETNELAMGYCTLYGDMNSG